MTTSWEGRRLWWWKGVLGARGSHRISTQAGSERRRREEEEEEERKSCPGAAGRLSARLPLSLAGRASARSRAGSTHTRVLRSRGKVAKQGPPPPTSCQILPLANHKRVSCPINGGPLHGPSKCRTNKPWKTRRSGAGETTLPSHTFTQLDRSCRDREPKEASCSSRGPACDPRGRASIESGRRGHDIPIVWHHVMRKHIAL